MQISERKQSYKNISALENLIKERKYSDHEDIA